MTSYVLLHTALQSEQPSSTVPIDIEWQFDGYKSTESSPNELPGVFSVNGQSYITYSVGDLIGGGYNPNIQFESQLPGIYLFTAKSLSDMYSGEDSEATLTVSLRLVWRDGNNEPWLAKNDDNEDEPWFW